MGSEAIWMSAKDALIRITARIGNEQEALRILDKAASEGAFQIRGKTVVTELDLGNVRLSPPVSGGGSVQQVTTPAEGKYTQMTIGDWARNRSPFLPRLLLWEASIFVMVDPPLGIVTQHKSGKYTVPARTRRVLYDVEVQAQQIEDLARSLAAPKLRVRREAPVEWDFSEVVDEIKADILGGDHAFGPVHKRGAQAKIERHISEKLGFSFGRTPSESTVRRAATQVMSFWRAHFESTQS